MKFNLWRIKIASISTLGSMIDFPTAHDLTPRPMISHRGPWSSTSQSLISARFPFSTLFAGSSLALCTQLCRHQERLHRTQHRHQAGWCQPSRVHRGTDEPGPDDHRTPDGEQHGRYSGWHEHWQDKGYHGLDSQMVLVQCIVVNSRSLRPNIIIHIRIYQSRLLFFYCFHRRDSCLKTLFTD